MDVKEILDQARDTMTARRVYGEPIERDGLLLVPAAAVIGGGGAGSGESRSPVEGGPSGEGSGGGWGGIARPAGAFVIREGRVDWQPAVDVNRIILGGQVVAIVALLVLRSVLRARRRRLR
jgi:uncharacterized spore protein YtfJ